MIDEDVSSRSTIAMNNEFESHQISDEQLLHQIANKAKSFYQSLDPWHDVKHGQRVVAIALKILETEPADKFLVEAGAWLHQYHDDLPLLKKLLDSVSVTQQQKAALTEIVENCRPLKISSECSIEAKIVFDADALELFGPSGTIREIQCNGIFRGKDPDRCVEDTREVQALFRSRLQTETGKRIARDLIKSDIEFWTVHDRWERTFEVSNG